jgi:hypothetical protein
MVCAVVYILRQRGPLVWHYSLGSQEVSSQSIDCETHYDHPSQGFNHASSLDIHSTENNHGIITSCPSPAQHVSIQPPPVSYASTAYSVSYTPHHSHHDYPSSSDAPSGLRSDSFPHISCHHIHLITAPQPYPNQEISHRLL